MNVPRDWLVIAAHISLLSLLAWQGSVLVYGVSGIHTSCARRKRGIYRREKLERDDQ